MTDARIPERYLADRRILRLTDTERASYFMATLWSVSNRTDGRFEQDDLAFIPTFNTAVISTLVSVGLWAKVSPGVWVDTEFKTVQTSKDDLEVLERAREADRKKKARQRAHKAGDHELCDGTCDMSPGHTPIRPRDRPRDVSPGQHRKGQDRKDDRKGQDEGEAFPPLTWPTAPIPGDTPLWEDDAA